MTDEEIAEIKTRCCLSSWTMEKDFAYCDGCESDVTEEIKLEIKITEEYS